MLLLKRSIAGAIALMLFAGSVWADGLADRRSDSMEMGVGVFHTHSLPDSVSFRPRELGSGENLAERKRSGNERIENMVNHVHRMHGASKDDMASQQSSRHQHRQHQHWYQGVHYPSDMNAYERRRWMFDS